jgi:gamma-glutamylcyclotransferase (GGCT)/AIG2-like uncharacterized protein YtfP
MTGGRATGATTDPDRLIALYGTLRDANVRRELGLTGRVRRLGRCRLQGVMHDLGPYPALAEGKGVVHGELFELLDGSVLAAMDAYEEFDAARPKLSAYIRVRVRLTDPDLECWIYRYNRSLRGVPRVLGGDWVKHRGLRRSLPLPRPL